MPDAVAIAILAKAPVAGFAKTRLIPRLGPEGAAELQRWLVERIARAAREAATGPVTLWTTPDSTHPVFQRLAADGGLALARQPEGDLGVRMAAAIAATPKLAGTLVVGTDCPALDAAHLRQAAAALRTSHDAVVSPALDGGYVLIGMRRRAPVLFADIPWSTAGVMATTRQRLAQARLTCLEMPPLADLDTPADYDRLRAQGLVPAINPDQPALNRPAAES